MPKAGQPLWNPSAPVENLRKRARIIQQIRNFFSERGVLEVETPLLCRTVNSDPYVSAFTTEKSPAFFNQRGFLQTSPEFAMKRLLAAGSGDIYQICKAFRQDECARLHNPEFTIMEWYRLGFDRHQLIDEIQELIKMIIPEIKIDRLTYLELFSQYAKFNPFSAETAEIKACLQSQGIQLMQEDFQRDTWLDIVMTHIIEPQIKEKWVFVYDYPVSQAALARVRNDTIPVAERFELYAHGIELANGFHELTDPEEQHQRFINDNKSREAQGLPVLPVDEHLIEALRAGIPACAGVALGVDRLIMLALGVSQLSDVLSFSADRV